MKRHSTILVALACSALGMACSSGGTTSGGGGGGGIADTGGAADTTGGGDTAGDTGGSDAGKPGDTSGVGGDAFATDGGGETSGDPCSCQGKQCGFIKGCPKTCGGCPSGKKCVSNQCESTQTVALKKFGEWCGPTKDCQPPPAGAANNSPEAAAFVQCLNAQCETDVCSGNICTKACNVSLDEKDNASGAAGPDGIEDDGANSECADAVEGPEGAAFKCVQRLPAANVRQGQSNAICMSGSSWKVCTKDADCGATDACRLYYISGQVTLRCGPKLKNLDKSPGTPVGKTCNSNPASGDVSVCASDFCLGLGSCSAFCTEDADCVSDVGACKAGKCPDGNACTSDVQCSSWRCRKGVQLYGDIPTKFNLCFPMNCELDADCKSDENYCRIFYNGVQNAKGEPDPEDATKVLLPGWSNMCVAKPKNGAKKGEACDPYTADDDKTLKACGVFLCDSGMCGAVCKGDTDCPSNMTCGISENPLDFNDPPDDIYDYYLPLKMCKATPGKAGACEKKSDCKDGKYCKFLQTPVSLPKDATPVDYGSVFHGACIDPDKAKKNFGDQCGPASTETGMAKVCQSGICLNTQNQQGQPQPGYCSEYCGGGKADCPATVTAYGQQYKTICRSLFWGWNSTSQPFDDIFVPLCLPTGTSNSLTDCSATKACTGNMEACVGFGVATGPDKGAKVEYSCISVANAPTQANQNPPQPTKKVGEACKLESDFGECLTAYCLEDVKAGEGYCSRTCNADSDCGSGMVCDKGFMSIPRKDPTKAGFMPLCKKVKSCLPCAYDHHCAGGYKCTNIGGAGTAANQRCAPPCKSDADCASADSGATKCTAAKDSEGVELGHKVCAPTVTFCQ